MFAQVEAIKRERKFAYFIKKTRLVQNMWTRASRCELKKLRQSQFAFLYASLLAYKTKENKKVFNKNFPDWKKFSPMPFLCCDMVRRQKVKRWKLWCVHKKRKNKYKFLRKAKKSYDISRYFSIIWYWMDGKWSSYKTAVYSLLMVKMRAKSLFALRQKRKIASLQRWTRENEGEMKSRPSSFESWRWAFKYKK